MARRDDMEPIGGFPKAGVASASEQPQRLAGWLTKRVMITEREPLYHDGSGLSIGQLVDKQLQAFEEAQNRHHDPHEVRPVIHSVTVELPVE